MALMLCTGPAGEVAAGPLAGAARDAWHQRRRSVTLACHGPPVFFAAVLGGTALVPPGQHVMTCLLQITRAARRYTMRCG